MRVPRELVGNGPNTVSESTVLDTELIEFFCPHFTRPQLGPFFVLKFVRSRGISSTVSKVSSDRKAVFKHKNARQ